MLDEKNVFWILKEAIFNSEYRNNYFLNNETTVGMVIEPTIFNIMKNVFRDMSYIFDVSIIFGTMWFQIIIPIFATISGIVFYQSYHTRMKFELCKFRKYRIAIIKEMCLNSVKLSGTIFIAYFVFILFAECISVPDKFGASERSLFSDLFGNGLYLNYTFIYFLLEGVIRFFLIPFTYAMLSQSIVLLNKSIKEVIAAPMLYYYGLSAVGYATAMIIPKLSIYINPSVLMASGSYDQFNTILLIGVNLIPLFIAIAIIRWKIKHVEV